MVTAPPGEELGFICLAGKVGARAIREVRLRRAMHRMIAGIDSRHRSDRAELPDGGVGDLTVIHDVGIIAERDLVQDGARANFAISAGAAVTQVRGRIDKRLCGQLAGHECLFSIRIFPGECRCIGREVNISS